MENSIEKIEQDAEATENQAKWQTLSRHQRRVLGVLIEKSKTTPDVYPMTINGIKTGCNQKSNRSPQMELSESMVEDVLYELRQLGCVIEVHAGGRVPKYKHMAYEWLRVAKVELGVMAELLLRGEQTLGELRTRASRMEKGLDSLEDLQPVLQQLREKRLVVDLTPPGRGQVVSHNLYTEKELEKLLVDFERERQSDVDRKDDPRSRPTSEDIRISSLSQESDSLAGLVENLVFKLESMESQIQQLQNDVSDLKLMIES